MDLRAAPGRPTRPGLPRTRGDGPRHLTGGQGRLGASPHPRGWTQQVRERYRTGPGFPAPAGMDPARRRDRASTAGLPRTRGDGPDAGCVVTLTFAASPHPRGWTSTQQPVPDSYLGFPAPAGMDPRPLPTPRACRRLPRTRGDGPASTTFSRAPAAASPHPRGWTRGQYPATADRDGFPAPAGMDRAHRGGHVVAAGLPRTRGDGPVITTSTSLTTWASPHPRGWTCYGTLPVTWMYGFPAPAGMDRTRYHDRADAGGLPRTRGDGPGTAGERCWG